MSTATTPARQPQQHEAGTPVAELQTLDRVYSANYGQHLTVVGLSYGKVPVADVLDGTAKPIAATLSADGRAWAAAWHTPADGPEAEAVYVETHDRDGVRFHGWVDSRSRRIVQAG